VCGECVCVCGVVWCVSMSMRCVCVCGMVYEYEVCEVCGECMQPC